MKRAYTFVAVGIVVIFLVVIGIGSGGRCPDLPQSQKKQLVAEAKTIFATVSAESQTNRHTTITPAPYPHLSSLTPKKVTLRSDGLYICMKKGFVIECGYFIPSPSTKVAELNPNGDPSYEKTDDMFYIYRIKG